MGAEKAWNGDLQTPCGSAGEARLYIASAKPALPHPSFRPGLNVRAADEAWVKAGCNLDESPPSGGAREGLGEGEGAATLER
jgi:hypothetical protein